MLLKSITLFKSYFILMQIQWDSRDVILLLQCSISVNIYTHIYIYIYIYIYRVFQKELYNFESL